VLRKSFITFAAAVALGCVPVATSALAAGHPGNHGGAGHASAAHASVGHATAGRAMAVRSRGGHGGGRYAGGYHSGPIYNSYGGGYDGCSGYGYGYGYDSGYGGCRGYGVPLVGAIVGGILGR
jgi:hypothetical protein